MPWPYYSRGLAYYCKGDYDRAIEDYNQAIKLNPKDAKTYNNRGRAHYYKGDYDRAIEDYNQAIKLNPEYVIAYNNRGRALPTTKEIMTGLLRTTTKPLN